jgi:hypothetical protein
LYYVAGTLLLSQNPFDLLIGTWKTFCRLFETFSGSMLALIMSRLKISAVKLASFGPRRTLHPVSNCVRVFMKVWFWLVFLIKFDKINITWKTFDRLFQTFSGRYLRSFNFEIKCSCSYSKQKRNELFFDFCPSR